MIKITHWEMCGSKGIRETVAAIKKKTKKNPKEKARGRDFHTCFTFLPHCFALYALAWMFLGPVWFSCWCLSCVHALCSSLGWLGQAPRLDLCPIKCYVSARQRCSKAVISLMYVRTASRSKKRQKGLSTSSFNLSTLLKCVSVWEFKTQQ